MKRISKEFYDFAHGVIKISLLNYDIHLLIEKHYYPKHNTEKFI